MFGDDESLKCHKTYGDGGRERETHTDRQTDGQTDRQTDK